MRGFHSTLITQFLHFPLQWEGLADESIQVIRDKTEFDKTLKLISLKNFLLMSNEIIPSAHPLFFVLVNLSFTLSTVVLLCASWVPTHHSLQGTS